MFNLRWVKTALRPLMNERGQWGGGLDIAGALQNAYRLRQLQRQEAGLPLAGLEAAQGAMELSDDPSFDPYAQEQISKIYGTPPEQMKGITGKGRAKMKQDAMAHLNTMTEHFLKQEAVFDDTINAPWSTPDMKASAQAGKQQLGQKFQIVMRQLQTAYKSVMADPDVAGAFQDANTYFVAPPMKAPMPSPGGGGASAPPAPSFKAPGAMPGVGFTPQTPPAAPMGPLSLTPRGPVPTPGAGGMGGPSPLGSALSQQGPMGSSPEPMAGGWGAARFRQQQTENQRKLKEAMDILRAAGINVPQ